MPATHPNKFKVPGAIWSGLEKIGLAPAAVLRHARLPLSLASTPKATVTTGQYFALWQALGDIVQEPAVGIRLATAIDPATLPPSFLAASYARDLGDALNRIARFKLLCSPEHMTLTEDGNEVVIETNWLDATGAEPAALTDATFAAIVDMARRATGAGIVPKRVDLKSDRRDRRAHEDYYGCAVKLRARRNGLALHKADLDRPFMTHNAEMLAIVDPHLVESMQYQQSRGSILGQIKWALKTLLSASVPTVAIVARELGLSERTLQRRITEEGTSFRELLTEARRELGRQYLAEKSIDIGEVAYLLGFEDQNSFYRAFRAWEGMTPTSWRRRLGPAEQLR